MICRAFWRPSSCFALAIACLLAGLRSAQAADKRLAVADVVKAWRERSASARSYSFTWSGKQFMVGTGVPPPARLPTPKITEARSAEHTLDLRFLFTADSRGRVRFESYGSQWSNDEERFVPHEQLTVFDGRQENTLYSGAGPGFQSASIENASRSRVAGLVQLDAWRLVYRPFDPEPKMLRCDGLELDATPVVIDGKRCVTLSQSADGSRGARTVFAELSSGFYPIQFVERRPDGVVRELIRLEYSKSAAGENMPSAWSITLSNKRGKMFVGYSGKITASDTNQRVADSVFDLTIPPRTWVNDYAAKKTYITRDGGGRRPITPGEFNGKNFTALLHTDPPGFFTWRAWAGCWRPPC